MQYMADMLEVIVAAVWSWLQRATTATLPVFDRNPRRGFIVANVVTVLVIGGLLYFVIVRGSLILTAVVLLVVLTAVNMTLVSIVNVENSEGQYTRRGWHWLLNPIRRRPRVVVVPLSLLAFLVGVSIVIPVSGDRYFGAFGAINMLIPLHAWLLWQREQETGKKQDFRNLLNMNWPLLVALPVVVSVGEIIFSPEDFTGLALFALAPALFLQVFYGFALYRSFTDDWLRRLLGPAPQSYWIAMLLMALLVVVAFLQSAVLNAAATF